jgi:ATP-dependent Clp protease protease subunit
MGKHTGHSWKEIEEYFLRDRYLNALEAKEFGLIDEVLGDTSDLIKLGNNELSVELVGQKLLEKTVAS